LRWLEADGDECIRMLGVVVRDRAWRTLSPSKLRMRHRLQGWAIDGETAVDAAALTWRLSFAPRSSGMEMQATMTAHGQVTTNRAGIVVLLPAAIYAGGYFAVRHGDETMETGRLPACIAPHQPVRDVVSLKLSPVRGPMLTLAFEGETFEMEDQRNWLDPSFKLYSRSLSKPVPYRIRDGERTEQRVVIDLVGKERARSRRGLVNGTGALPALGVATAMSRVPRGPIAVPMVAETRPAFVLHRTDASACGVRAAARLARLLHAELRLETFGDSAVLADAIVAMRPASIARYFAGEHVDGAIARSHAEVTDGTFADFVMVNRNGVPATAERVAFALCPTVHARDDRTLVESLDALLDVFEQARGLAGRRKLDVGPCSLRRRLTPVTGEPAVRGPRQGQGDYDVDPRQHERIAAAWLTSVIALAAAAGVDSLCTFEAEGSRGLVEVGAGTKLAADPRVLSRSPSHAVLCGLAEERGRTLSLRGFDARVGTAFVVHGTSTELWLVDLSGKPRSMPRARTEAEKTGAHLVCGRDGARWSTMRDRRQRVAPYGIVRIGLAGVRRDVASTICKRWFGFPHAD
jgi:D-apionolactonase